MSDQDLGQLPTSVPDVPPDVQVVTPEERALHLPSPTVWPAIAASGITLMLWGLITSFVVTGAGAALFIIAAVGWAQKILTEMHEHGGEEG